MDETFPFYIDQEVEYKNSRGYVIFMCEYSLSICVSPRKTPVNKQVRLVVPNYDWDKITPCE